MRRPRSLLAATAVAAAVTAATVVPIVALTAASAYATDTPAIGLDRGTDLLVVPASGSLPAHFVVAGFQPGQDYARNGAVVTDAGGLNSQPVGDLAHVTSVALGPDGRTVWAASYDGQLASFSVDDPSQVTTYPTGDFGCPFDLAVAGDGRVYFSAGCDAAKSVAVLDPSTKDVTAVTTGGLAGPLTGPVFLANGTSAPNVLAVLSGASGTHLDIEDVSGATPVETGSVDELASAAVAVSPDGSTIAVGQQGYGLQRYDTTGETVGTPTPPTSLPANGLAFSSDGHYLGEASQYRFSSYGPDALNEVRGYTPAADNMSDGRGVDWLGQTLVTMTTDEPNNSVYLHLHPDGQIAPSTLTASGPTTIRIGQTIALTGHLSDRGTTIGNTHVTVTRTDGAGTVSVGTATVGPQGNYGIHLSVPNGETTTWRVTYAGDDHHGATTASFSRYVQRYSTYLTLRTDHTEYPWNGYIHLTAHLGSTYSNRHVTIWEQQTGYAAHRVAYAVVDGAGNLARTVHVYRDVHLWVTFGGDLRHATARVTIIRPVYAQVTTTLGGWYRTSGSYRLYHSSAQPRLHEHVAPNKAGQCGYFYGETYQGGKWVELGESQCFALDGGSNVYAYFNGSHTVGQKFRFLSVWFGDGYNHAAASNWSYVEFTS